MKEYRIQLWLENGKKWCNIRELNQLKTEYEARSELEERQKCHPKNKYRIVERTVTEWQELQ